jgi:Rrf2 family protein
MHLKLGKRADYAIRAVLDLARHWEPDGRRKSREIAETMDIPTKYLPQLLAMLVRVGLVESESGPDGGYRLASDPTAVSLLAIIEAVEGPLRSDECVLRGGPCHWETRCAIHEPWADAQDAMRRELEETTFADLVAADAKLEGGLVAG